VSDKARRLRHWIGRVDDLSGTTGQWDALEAVLPRVEPLLALCGAYYLPFLEANVRAISNDEPVVQVTLAGHDYEQAPFRYQAKCYGQLVAAYQALPDPAREALSDVLGRTGCRLYLPGD
jgi:hypothetical protein